MTMMENVTALGNAKELDSFEQTSRLEACKLLVSEENAELIENKSDLELDRGRMPTLMNRMEGQAEN
jgi:hypothetical protein